MNRIKGGFLILIHKGPILERNEKNRYHTNFYKLSMVTWCKIYLVNRDLIVSYLMLLELLIKQAAIARVFNILIRPFYQEYETID